MTDPREFDDDELTAALGDALADADPVPDTVRAVARGAFAWRTIDAELAELGEVVFDSALDTAGLRDTATGSRQLTFRGGDRELELMIDDGGRLIGQLVPGRAAAVRLDMPERSLHTDSDRLGRFRFDDVATGPIRLAVASGEESADFLTDWVLL